MGQPQTQIHLITGKGGVGKSTVAAVLARQIAQKNPKNRVLLVELGSQSFYQHYFHLKNPIESKPQASGLGFDIALWSGESCLREYALHLLKIESLYRLFFENPISKTLIQVAPGLSELAMTGKITSGPPRNVGPKLPYDTLVVDAYASGHFLALLKAPLAMKESVRLGPIHDQSVSILKILADPSCTQFHIVCLPEVLPVQESEELFQQLKSLFPKQTPQFWMNKLINFPHNFLDEPAELRELLTRKKARQEALLDRANQIFQNFLTLDYSRTLSELQMIHELAQTAAPFNRTKSHQENP